MNDDVPVLDWRVLVKGIALAIVLWAFIALAFVVLAS